MNKVVVMVKFNFFEEGGFRKIFGFMEFFIGIGCGRLGG